MPPRLSRRLTRNASTSKNQQIYGAARSVPDFGFTVLNGTPRRRSDGVLLDNCAESWQCSPDVLDRAAAHAVVSLHDDRPPGAVGAVVGHGEQRLGDFVPAPGE